MAMTTSFGITYDYRCPFARIVHENITTALRAGADWDVDFVPFSLSQIHVEEGEIPVWENPAKAPELMALEASLLVADMFPERFLDVHDALFSARHDHSRDLRKRDVVLDVLQSAGADTAEIAPLLDSGSKRDELRKLHEDAVASHQVFGVPTFIVGPSASFVRLMDRPNGNAELAQKTIEKVLGLVTDHPEINEFKHTTIPF
jgi:protein-disulfide isomerase